MSKFESEIKIDEKMKLSHSKIAAHLCLTKQAFICILYVYFYGDIGQYRQ